eukprot:TRINITY_DN382_c0_g1_i20.p1 TRINITY_DN382_c0_g1~~TRINITY_DN382_c0_g1_i20.p1  ORF type:complete len:178 (-),score=50.01 TRINITY_DN382_c0_g1_i20:48-581(-)
MLRSLVGSEMCIRDSLNTKHPQGDVIGIWSPHMSTIKSMGSKSCLSVTYLLELGKEHLEGLGALTEVADAHGGALEVLLDVALGVTLNETSPLGQLCALLNHDDVDVVDLAESLDELLVTGILAVGGKDAKVGAAAVEGASDLGPVSYTHLRAHETPEHLVCRLLLEKKKKKKKQEL